jgi:hypothetical protein
VLHRLVGRVLSGPPRSCNLKSDCQSSTNKEKAKGAKTLVAMSNAARNVNVSPILGDLKHQTPDSGLCTLYDGTIFTIQRNNKLWVQRLCAARMPERA